jgi:hypothetical protein
MLNKRTVKNIFEKYIYIRRSLLILIKILLLFDRTNNFSIDDTKDIDFKIENKKNILP